MDLRSIRHFTQRQLKYALVPLFMLSFSYSKADIFTELGLPRDTPREKIVAAYKAKARPLMALVNQGDNSVLEQLAVLNNAFTEFKKGIISNSGTSSAAAGTYARTSSPAGDSGTYYEEDGFIDRYDLHAAARNDRELFLQKANELLNSAQPEYDDAVALMKHPLTPEFPELVERALSITYRGFNKSVVHNLILNTAFHQKPYFLDLIRIVASIDFMSHHFITAYRKVTPSPALADALRIFIEAANLTFNPREFAQELSGIQGVKYYKPELRVFLRTDAYLEFFSQLYFHYDYNSSQFLARLFRFTEPELISAMGKASRMDKGFEDPNHPYMSDETKRLYREFSAKKLSLLIAAAEKGEAAYQAWYNSNPFYREASVDCVFHLQHQEN